MDQQKPEFKTNPRGFVLFVVALFLWLILYINSEEGMTWELWGMLGMSFLGLCFFIKCLHARGKEIEEERKSEAEKK